MTQAQAPAGGMLYDAGVFSRAEDALAFVEALLESSTEYSIIGKNMDGVVVLWNAGARRIYGWKPNEIIGRSADVLHPLEDVRLGLPRTIRETATRAGKWEGILTRVRKDGQTFQAKVVMTPRRDARGTQVGFLLISKDVTAETRLAAELQLAEKVTASSTPILSIKRGLLLVPLIGVLDARRAEQLTQQLLQEVRDRSARAVVLDVTGLPVIDAASAECLIRAITACRLIGARVILTGVSTANGLAMVELGISLEGLMSAGDLETGIERAEQLLVG